MKVRIIGIALLAVAFFAACEKEEEKTAKELLTEKYFNLINHCHEYGFVKFDSDGGGHLSFDRTCELGYDCNYMLPFDWSLSGSTLTLTYVDNGAMVVCGNLDIDPVDVPWPETVTFTENTNTLILQGLTFKK